MIDATHALADDWRRWLILDSRMYNTEEDRDRWIALTFASDASSKPVWNFLNSVVKSSTAAWQRWNQKLKSTYKKSMR